MSSWTYAEMISSAKACRDAEGIVDAAADAQYKRRIIDGDWHGLIEGATRPDCLTRSERIETGEESPTRNSSPGMINRNSRPVKYASEKVCINIRKNLASKEGAQTLVNLKLDEYKAARLELLPMGAALDLMKSLWSLPNAQTASVETATPVAQTVQASQSVSVNAESVSTAPKKAERVHPTEEGAYWLTRNGERIPVNVSVSKSSGYLFAELWNGQSFVYEKGLIYKIDANDMMTLDEAKEFGKKYVRCVRCKRALTKKESKAKGIGPVCEGKF